jgi:energy-converting hydrogenase Eha subunit B
MTVLCFSVQAAISGGQTIVSKGGSFELGFFRTAGATATIKSSRGNYCVGIWYKKLVSRCTPVWVANRAAPVTNPASSWLAIAADGNLVLLDEAGKLI